ncbi:MAG: hypothetical protein ACWGQW_00380 [bacterium]
MDKNCSHHGSSWCQDFECEDCPIDPTAKPSLGKDIPMIKPDNLEEALEALDPTDLLSVMDRGRPYNGQPWTDTGERGKQEVSGVTMRDIRDCFIRACYDSRPPEQNPPDSVYKLDWEQIDVMAVCQNMTCWIERYMGIYPNVPDLKETDGA